jgi:hypothetical protein
MASTGYNSKTMNQRQYMLYIAAAYDLISPNKFEKEDKMKVLCLEMELERRYHVSKYGNQKTRNPQYIGRDPWTGRRWLTARSMFDALHEAKKSGLHKTDDLSIPARTRASVYDGFSSVPELRRFFWSLYRARGDEAETDNLLDKLDERLTRMFYERASKNTLAAQQGIGAEATNLAAGTDMANIDATAFLYTNSMSNNNTMMNFWNNPIARSYYNLMANNGVSTNACYDEEGSNFLDPKFAYSLLSSFTSLEMNPFSGHLVPDWSYTLAGGSAPVESASGWTLEDLLTLS